MSDSQRERDLVLNPNEYAYVLDKTKGLISCVVGPHKMSLSTSDALVIFNEDTKRFEEVYSFSEAVKTFVIAPENWYVELKNPVMDERLKYPTAGTSNALPEFRTGKKINIKGNASFALYPGQIARVIQGHRLYSNQYLLARVYDADALMESLEHDKKMQGSIPSVPSTPNVSDTNPETRIEGAEPDTEIPQAEDDVTYTTGQILVIKGTDTSFYIPPTGIEVIPVGGTGKQYVRDAVTLEKLEYCILKNERGQKKYIHGDAVVFPQPDEVFITNPDAKSETDKYKFKAIELSDISGIYVKVIADYTENDVAHHTGEELFITGKEQMIYYPRPEHAIIDYDGQVVHYAIAIPMGEGRYILERMTGNVKLIKGPAMYLPDPRTEVVVQRKLSKKECELWYPGNAEALAYNTGIGMDDDDDDECCMDSCRRSVFSNSGISRSNKYTKPRTITIDNKFDGAVAVTVWTGYAVNVVSKGGKRKVVTGPQTYLMEYDETLEAVTLSTGKPKTTDHLIETVYLRVDNNKVSDVINVQTKDFVDVSVKVSYCLDFLASHKDKWFNVENYVKYMTDRQRSLLKMEAKKHTIEDFYENTTTIVRNTLLHSDKSNSKGHLFEENGMLVKDVEVLSVSIQDDVEDIMNDHQLSMVRKSLELANAEKEIEVAKKLANAEKEKIALEKANEMYKLEMKTQVEKARIANDEALARLQEESDIAAKNAKKAIQEILDEIQKSELARKKNASDAEIAEKKEYDALEAAKQKSYADNVKKVMDAVGPELVAALTSKSNADMLAAVTTAMGPYAIAGEKSVADVTNLLLRGTSLEGVLETVSKVINKEEDL